MEEYKVEFLSVLPTYPMIEQTYVHFTGYYRRLNCLWRPRVGDCVGIAKADSGSLTECMYRKCITQELLDKFGNSREFYVVFDLKGLTVDSNVDYQFIYISNGERKGVSTKFRLIRRLMEIRSLSDYTIGDYRIPAPKNLGDAKVDMEKFLTELRLNPLQYVDTIKEILNENLKLNETLERANKELVELKDERKDMKSLCSDLIKKLSVSERKVDTHERERRSVEEPVPTPGLSYKCGINNMPIWYPLVPSIPSDSSIPTVSSIPSVSSVPLVPLVPSYPLTKELELKLLRICPDLKHFIVDGKLPLNFNLMGYLESELKRIWNKPGSQKEDLIELIFELKREHESMQIKPIVPLSPYHNEVKRSTPTITSYIPTTVHRLERSLGKPEVDTPVWWDTKKVIKNTNTGSFYLPLQKRLVPEEEYSSYFYDCTY